MTKTVTFRAQDRSKAKFFPVLSRRVNAYFTENGITKYGNHNMVIKTIAMFAMYLGPFALMLAGVVTNPWAMLACCGVMGIGLAGIGMCVMHDANHGSYSKNDKINRIIGLSLNLVGGHAFNWKVQHNYLHHTYTNVHGLDQDIREKGILRFSPHAPLAKYHKLQHIYAFLLYGLMTFSWILTKDYQQMAEFRKKGYDKTIRANFASEVAILIISKLVYFGYIAVLPIMVLDISFLTWFAGFFFMHWVAGFTLAMIFQMAHLIEETDHHPFPHDTGTIDNQWAIHQLETTANFGTGNRLLNWYAGGLNFQVEHHLFPGICHIHYKAISKIVRETAEEYGIAYYEKPSLWAALASHYRLLWKLGHGKPVIMNHAH
jgi:linoleoyl-CoA desaturase